MVGATATVDLEAKAAPAVTATGTQSGGGFTYIQNYDSIVTIPGTNIFHPNIPCVKLSYPAGDHRKYGLHCTLKDGSPIGASTVFSAVSVKIPYREGKTIMAYGGNF